MAVTEVKAWRTSDGRLCADEHEANVHEAKLTLVRRLKDGNDGDARLMVGSYMVLVEDVAEWALENVEALDQFIEDWRDA